MKVADKDLTPQGQIRQVMHGVADRTETGLTKKDILVEKVKQPDGSVKLLYKRKGKAKAAKDRYTSKSTPSSFKAWSDITQQVWKEMGTPDMKRVNDVVKKGTPTYKEIKRRHEAWKKKHGIRTIYRGGGETGQQPCAAYKTKHFQQQCQKCVDDQKEKNQDENICYKKFKLHDSVQQLLIEKKNP